MIGMSSVSFRQSLVLQIIPDENFALGQASHTYLEKNKGLLINTMSVNYKNLAWLLWNFGKNFFYLNLYESWLLLHVPPSHIYVHPQVETIIILQIKYPSEITKIF